MDKTFKLQFEADLHINKAKGALADLQKNLSQLKLPDSMFASTTKDIAKLENYIKDFQSLANKTSFSTKDVDNLVKTYSKIEDLARKLNIDTQAIGGLNINKLLPPETAQRLEQFKGLLEEVQGLIDFKDSKPKQLQTLTDELDTTEKKVDELTNKLKELNKVKEQANKDLINNRVEQANLKEQLKALQEKKKALEKPRGKESKEYKDNERELDKLEQKAKALQIKIDGLKQKLAGNPNSNSYITANTSLKEKQNELANVQAQIEALSRANEGIARRKPGTQLKEYQDLTTQINELISKLEALKIKENEIKTTQKESGSSISSTTSELDNETEKIANLKAQIDNLNNNNLDVTKLDQIRQTLADMMGVDISQIPTNLEDVKNIINQLSDEELQAIRTALEGTAGSSQNLTEILKQLGIELGKVKGQSEQFDNRMRDVSALKSRIQYFFGLANSINLVKRAIHSAFETVKELDAAMTETAVVTDHTISDMWNKLPEYTKRANQLGVSTLAAYKSATLYYQQGLNDTQAGELSVETLKMARIAGLEAAEATDRMTNALRGFNMELNTIDAQRVDDVYSQLAAMSASNVDEISTAMTKVASLAHNANMEFETTAAFLAQIIETTRESAETAGTALKTVVARFSEVKKLVDEGTLRGQDEEGQVVDVNKVSQALRTAGIDLNKYFLGEVGLDDIFMELASKWDSLTNVQQRYIATQAAGSRQQSRFIALMQDYARTQQLVGAAYDAEGASARQFEKTQDSLQSKLERLKNAWNEFLMGITNSGIIKGAVNALTLLLNVINKITGAFGPAISGFLKFGVAAGAVVAGKKAFSNGGIATKAIGALGNTKVGSWLGFGGNEVTNSGNKVAGALNTTAAKITTGGNEIAAAMHGAAGKIAGKSAGRIIEKAAAIKKANLSDKLGYLTSNKDAYLKANTEYQEALRNQKLWFSSDNPFAEGLSSSEIKEFQQYYNQQLLERTKAEQAARAKLGLGGFSPEEAREKVNNYDWDHNIKFTPLEKLGKATANSKLFGGLSSKIADAGGGKVGGALAKLFGFGEGAAAAQAAAGLAVAIGGITVAAGAAAIAIKLMYDASPAGQLKQAKEYAKTIEETAKSAQKTADNYKNVQRNYKDYTDKINSSTSVSERETTIQDRNDYITSLLESDPNYAKYISSTIDESGQFILTLDEVALANAVNTIADNAIKTAIASQVAQANVNVQQAQVYEQRIQSLQEWINSAKLYGEEVKPQWEADLAYYQNQVASLGATAQNQISAAARQMLSNSGLDSELANKLADIYAETYDSDKYQKKFDEYNLNAFSRLFGQGSRKQEYEAIYGVGSAEGLNRKQIADALAGYRIQTEQSEQLNNAVELIESGNYDQILDAIAGNIDVEDIDNYINDFSEELNTLATAFGKNAADLEKQLKQNQNARQKLIVSRKTNIYESALRNGVELPETLRSWIDNLNFDQSGQISDILTNAVGTISQDTFQNLFTSLPSLKDSELSELQDFFNNFDLDNPIIAFEKFNAAKEKAADGSVFSKILDNIEQTNTAIFSASNLVQSFIISADYDQLTDSVEKFIEENGRISADNIEELADSSKLLKSLLDSNTVSAKALANALTLVEQGKIGFEQLTDAILKALDAGTNFEEMMEEVDKWIKDFDPGTDLKEGTEHIVEQLENLKEYVSNWEFGNEPTKNIYEHIFGEGTYDQLVDEFGNDFEAFEKFVNGKISQYTTMAENAGLGGIQAATAAGVTGLSEIAGSGGQFFEWDLRQFASTTDAISEVASALGVTQEAAEAFILSWQTHIPKLRTEWNELDYSTQLQAFANELNGTRVITKQQLEALGATVGKSGDEVGRDLAEIINKINEARTAAGEAPIEIPVIVNWKDREGKDLTGKDLYSAFDEKFGTASRSYNGSQLEVSYDYSNYVSEFSTALETGIEGVVQGIDAQGLIGRLLEDGFSQAQANEMADHIAGSLSDSMLTQTVTVPKLADDGITITSEQVTVAADSMDGLKAAVDAAIEAANYKVAAQKLAESDYQGLANSISTATGNGVVNGATTGWNSFLESLAKAGPIHVPVDYYGPQAATGGMVRSFSSGSGDYFLQPGFALTGEEGPEIVWNKERGYAYITGQNGAEFQNLQPGDRVFNAAETQRIFRNSSFAKGGVFESFVSGGWKEGSDGSGSGSSSNSDKYQKQSTWRNELDWLYDLMEDIAEYERQQNIIQIRNELALEDIASSGRDLYKLTREELINLETQLDGQQAVQLKRLQQMGELQTQVNAAGYGRYMQWNQQDQTLEIDWDAIEAIQDKETYDEVVDWLNRMESVQDQIDDAEDAMWDIKKQIQELQQRYLQKYLDFQNRVLDAIVKQYQDQIDKLSEINDNVNDTNASILDSIQREIDLERQIRDNTDAESNIADMEARLAYLQRDTTGANATEIRQLQKQLDEARLSYGDTLIDQAVDRLSQSNEDAAAQREKQIELMQAQLDYWQESGGLWSEVEQLISTGFNGNGSLIRGSDLEKVLQNAENYEAMSQAQRDNWANELILETNQVGAHILELANGMNVNAEQIRALLTNLTGRLGGTPVHSYTAEKAEEKYATGGLNTYTGLAHLDGTPSAPEYVLNPEQTNAFLRLADVLPSIMGGDSIGGTTYGGDIYLNLSMHVDEIASDYDVDRIADRVKDILYDASSYRNVNTLNFIR